MPARSDQAGIHHERFEDDYYDAARSEVIRLEQSLVGGRRHAHEEAMRRRRRDENQLMLPGDADFTD
jgi:hypothetical protein